jgi:hypothetical protein
MNLHPSDVPHFAGIHYDGSLYQTDEEKAHIQSWLGERGLTLVNIPYPDIAIDELLNTMRVVNGEDFCYMLSGAGSSGHGHVAIYRGDKLLWCPSGDVGVVSAHKDEKPENRVYWVKFFGSMRCRFTPEEVQ